MDWNLAVWARIIGCNISRPSQPDQTACWRWCIWTLSLTTRVSSSWHDVFTQWLEASSSASMVNNVLGTDPAIQQSAFNIPRRSWSLLKPGFHYPSWRPELTALVDGWPVSITSKQGPCWQARVSTSRVNGPSTWLVETHTRQHGPCWRVMETGHPSTRVVETGL